MEQSDKKCHDCGVKPGELHVPGCDVERCPKCKGQAISCGCIYVFCGIDTDTMDQTHPDVYENGPTDDMYAKWDAEWDNKRKPWSGEWPGKAECRELGFYCRDLAPGGTPYTEDNPVPYFNTPRGIRFHVRCKKGDLGAHEDINRLEASRRNRRSCS